MREPVPDYAGRAVIADVTPMTEQDSPYGKRTVFQVAVEIPEKRQDGTCHVVRTKYLTPTLHEKSNTGKLVRSIFGRDLTPEEKAGFDLEKLIGTPVNVVIVQEHKDGKTYSNIISITPHKTGEPLQLSGHYVRVKDRPAKDSGSYRRIEQATENAADLGATKIHIGRCKGLEVRDLAPQQVQALIDAWLPAAKSNPKPNADDRRLIAALEQWQATNTNANAEADDLPY